MFLNADGRLTETTQRYIVRPAVPNGGSGDWEGPAADGRQFHGRYQQMIGPSREEGTPTRQISTAVLSLKDNWSITTQAS